MHENGFPLRVGRHDRGDGAGITIGAAGSVATQHEVEPRYAQFCGDAPLRIGVGGVVFGKIDHQPDVMVQQRPANDISRELGAAVESARLDDGKVIGKNPPSDRRCPSDDSLDNHRYADDKGNDSGGAMTPPNCGVFRTGWSGFQDLQEKRLLLEQFRQE